MLVTKKTPIIADRWFRNGDHPQDFSETILGEDGRAFWSEGKVVRYFRRPDIKGDLICQACKIQFDLHGWIDDGSLNGQGRSVCPGDYILSEGGEQYNVINAEAFKDEYEVLRS